MDAREREAWKGFVLVFGMAEESVNDGAKLDKNIQS